MTSNFDNRCEHIRRSRNKLERTQWYLGRNPERGEPIFLARKNRGEGGYVHGGPGCGKTSLVFSPGIEQSLADGYSVLVIDGKPDKSLFMDTYLAAKRFGVPFEVFSNGVGLTSMKFNPLRQSHRPRLLYQDLALGILEAVGLKYKEVYGESWFSDVAEYVLTAFLRSGRPIGNFRDLHSLLRNEGVYRAIMGRLDFDAAYHVAITIDRLAAIDHLNPGPDEPQIDVPLSITGGRPRAIYVHLNTSTSSSAAAALARFFIVALIQAASMFRDEETTRVNVWMDEVQNFIVESMRRPIEQGRSAGLSFFVANQSPARLKSEKLDFLTTVEACMSFELMLRVSSLDSMKRMQELSGQGLYHMASWDEALPPGVDTSRDGIFSIGHTATLFRNGLVKVMETLAPALSTNEILLYGALENHGIIRFSGLSDYTQFPYPVPIVLEHHVALEERLRRDKLPWPKDLYGASLVTTDIDKAKNAKPRGPQVFLPPSTK